MPKISDKTKTDREKQSAKQGLYIAAAKQAVDRRLLPTEKNMRVLAAGLLAQVHPCARPSRFLSGTIARPSPLQQRRAAPDFHRIPCSDRMGDHCKTDYSIDLIDRCYYKAFDGGLSITCRDDLLVKFIFLLIYGLTLAAGSVIMRVLKFRVSLCVCEAVKREHGANP